MKKNLSTVPPPVRNQDIKDTKISNRKSKSKTFYGKMGFEEIVFRSVKEKESGDLVNLAN